MPAELPLNQHTLFVLLNPITLYLELMWDLRQCVLVL